MLAQARRMEGKDLGDKQSSGWLIGSLCVISMGFRPVLALVGTGVVPKILPRPSRKVVVLGRAVTPSAMVHNTRQQQCT